MIRWSICFLLLIASCISQVPPATQAAVERGLDFTRLTGNLRLAIANGATTSSAQSEIPMSAVKMGPCSSTVRTLWSQPFSVNLNALGSDNSWQLGDATVPSGTYEYVSLIVDNVTQVVSIPTFTIEDGKQYMLIIAVDPVGGKSYTKYLAEIADGRSRIIYIDLNGHLASALPNRAACARSNDLCGNGVLDPGEECDDGNRNNNDGCSSECKLEMGFPLCHWECDNPVCDAICDPVCEPPHCVTHCTMGTVPPNCVCHAQAPKPECEIKCPRDGCEMDGCPACWTLCKDPTGGTVTCDQIDPNGATCDALPSLTCDVKCEAITCQWKCQKPECPKPKCELKCDSPANGVCANV